MTLEHRSESNDGVSTIIEVGNAGCAEKEQHSQRGYIRVTEVGEWWSERS